MLIASSPGSSLYKHLMFFVSLRPDANQTRWSLGCCLVFRLKMYSLRLNLIVEMWSVQYFYWAYMLELLLSIYHTQDHEFTESAQLPAHREKKEAQSPSWVIAGLIQRCPPQGAVNLNLPCILKERHTSLRQQCYLSWIWWSPSLSLRENEAISTPALH